MTAQELLVALQAPQAQALSGTVVATADLGLPTLPTGMASSAQLTDLVSGTHTLRVWQDGPDRTRLAMIGGAEESDIIRSGGDLWMWSSADRTADHYVLPERDAAGRSAAMPASIDVPSTPQEAADLVLKAIDGTTEVTTSGVAEVAGRPVYELILNPRQSDTLVDRVVIAIDGQTHVPLRLQVFSTVMAEPAYEVGFTSVDFTRPDAGIFAFTPPPGAKVTEHPAAGADPGATRSGSATRPTDPNEPTVVGTGWSQVVVGTLPAEQMAGLAGATGGSDASQGLDVAALLASLPRASGTWGSGRILSGTLVSAILTDDGRFAIGAVAPETLGAALAAS
jgi:outer membrane lipoprotein-sorting protein